MLKLGFIGAGNMGSAILRGLVASEYLTADDMAICDLNTRKLEELSDQYPGLTCTESDVELAEMCDMIVLAVKPFFMAEVIEHIRDEQRKIAMIEAQAQMMQQRAQQFLMDDPEAQSSMMADAMMQLQGQQIQGEAEVEAAEEALPVTEE